MTSSLSFGKALALAGFLGGLLPLACGDTDEDPKPPPEASGGEGGAGASPNGGGGAPNPPGISNEPKVETCGSQKCASASISLAAVYVDPCCAGPDEDTCGLDTGFLQLVGAAFEDTCQAKEQEGPLDAACPSPEQATVPLPTGGTAQLDAFPGCCRAETGTCGVVVNTLSLSGLPLSRFGLGCVDAAPFFPGQDPQPCGEGLGQGGASGASGAPGAGAPAVGGEGGVAAGGAPGAGAGAGGTP